MPFTTTLIIGAGQAGLAMSHHLSQLSIDHVLLERGDVANSWRTERWDSLRLLTPNWQSRLPGHTYNGNDPDGFSDMTQTIDMLSNYAQSITAPIKTRTVVQSVTQTDTGYKVVTNRGIWTCHSLVLATGACNIANVPAIADALPSSVRSITPMDYKNTDQLDDGAVLVVGASATGVQLAKEIQNSGREVYLSTGEHIRVPRTYRGKDIQWWMDQAGVMDMDLKEVDDIRRARNVPSLQLIGSKNNDMIDLNALQEAGITVVGRMMGLQDNMVQISGAMANVCALADLKMNRLIREIDQWSTKNGLDGSVDAPHTFEPTQVPETPLLGIDLKERNIKTVLWATGYRPDYSWLNVPVLDRKGALIHEGGVVAAPGLYAMGLPFMRKRKSSLMDGVGDDARDLSAHIFNFLAGKVASAA